MPPNQAYGTLRFSVEGGLMHLPRIQNALDGELAANAPAGAVLDSIGLERYPDYVRVTATWSKSS